MRCRKKKRARFPPSRLFLETHTMDDRGCGPDGTGCRRLGDLAIITSLLLFSALLGFWEEHEASNALDALKNSLALKARLLPGRDWYF
jgi:magnesium-transporting ATPase (P-type)